MILENTSSYVFSFCSGVFSYNLEK